jgi:hypothetical protein
LWFNDHYQANAAGDDFTNYVSRKGAKAQRNHQVTGGQWISPLRLGAFA